MIIRVSSPVITLFEDKIVYGNFYEGKMQSMFKVTIICKCNKYHNLMDCGSFYFNSNVSPSLNLSPSILPLHFSLKYILPSLDTQPVDGFNFPGCLLSGNV